MMKLIANGPGIGDAVFLTSVAYWYHKEFPNEPIDVIAKHTELFKNNPDINSVDENWTTAGFPELHNQKAIKEHNVQFMLRKLGVKNIPKWEGIRQYIYTTTPTYFLPPKSYITFQVKAGSWTRNKNWQLLDWYGLIPLIEKDLGIKAIQVGAKDDPEVCGDLPQYYLGAPLQEAAFLIKGAQLHICPVSGTMHMASGVGTKSIVLYGGREDPKITGYANNINLQPCHFSLEKKTGRNCSPCWLIEDCPYGHKDFTTKEWLKPCMELITIDQVLEEVKSVLSTNS